MVVTNAKIKMEFVWVDSGGKLNYESLTMFGLKNFYVSLCMALDFSISFKYIMFLIIFNL